MAYDDALFQLGMDLTRSSTAQKEDLFETAPASTGQSNSTSSGQDIILDLIGAKELASANAVEKALRAALNFLKTDSYQMTFGSRPHRGCNWVSAKVQGGIVSIETWPGTGYVSVDLAGTALRHELAMMALANAFGAREAILRPTRQASLSARYAKRHAPRTREPVPFARRAGESARTESTAKAA